jgi:DNA-directed RNA polymerase subunit RPC12/RpoP
MYWLTKTRCPKCKQLFDKHEFVDAMGIIAGVMPGSPSNGWPDASNAYPIGLVKIYAGGKKGEPKRYEYKCFKCGEIIGDEEYEKLVKGDRKPKKGGFDSQLEMFDRDSKRSRMPDLDFFRPRRDGL